MTVFAFGFDGSQFGSAAMAFLVPHKISGAAVAASDTAEAVLPLFSLDVGGTVILFPAYGASKLEELIAATDVVLEVRC